MGSLAELYRAEIPSIRPCKNHSGDLNIYNPEVFKLVLPPLLTPIFCIADYYIGFYCRGFIEPDYMDTYL